MNFNPRSLILVFVALIAAGGTAFLARNWLNAERSQTTVAKKQEVSSAVQILVAKKDLPAGLILKAEHVRWQAWPDKKLPKTYIRKSQGGLGSFVGAVVRSGIVEGEPITRARVVKPGERGFMAAVLAPGMRAISIPVTASSSVAGFIFPGDRVDLILSQTLKQGEIKRRTSETILQNVRVLAVDQRTDDQENKPEISKTATLEITPKQVEKVAVARQLGQLSLSLRSLSKLEIAEGTSASELAVPEAGSSHTWDSEVSRVLTARAGGGRTVNVTRGSETQSYRFRRAK
jgi:pilus assembly protein CpaB